MTRFLDFLTLFSSASTLICCALPALLVTLGAGSLMASLVGNFPQIIWLSQHKNLLFIFAGIMLALGGLLQHRAKNLPCPVDPELARACKSGRKTSKMIYIASLFIYVSGGFFAYIAPILID